MTSKNRFPPGWDAARIQRVLDHYEEQADEGLLRKSWIGGSGFIGPILNRRKTLRWFWKDFVTGIMERNEE